jgi:hypothetical protein
MSFNLDEISQTGSVGPGILMALLFTMLQSNNHASANVKVSNGVHASVIETQGGAGDPVAPTSSNPPASGGTGGGGGGGGKFI